MAACLGLTLVKRFTYRGDNTEEWSNTYHLRDAPPGDAASWLVVAKDIGFQEAHCYPTSSQIVRAYGYDSDAEDAVSVWSHDFILSGDQIHGDLPSAGIKMAGDQAAVISWRLDRKNSRGKWVYLRKYMHDGHVAAAGGDLLDTGYQTALQGFGDFLSGQTPQAHGGIRARTGTQGVTATGVIAYVTTRTLHRRGKRPLAHA